jgi:hypothetical protein
LVTPEEGVRAVRRPDISAKDGLGELGLSSVFILNSCLLQVHIRVEACTSKTTRLSGGGVLKEAVVVELRGALEGVWRGLHVAVLTKLGTYWLNVGVHTRQRHEGEVGEVFSDGHVKGIRSIEDIRVGLETAAALEIVTES